MTNSFKLPRMYLKGPKEILKNFEKVHYLDFTWNVVNKYNSYTDELFPRIDDLVKKFPDEKNFLNVLKSRLKMINVEYELLKYISEEYSWSEFDGVTDFYLRKFENLIVQIAEGVMYLLQFFVRNKKGYSGPSILKFKDVGDFLISSDNCLPDYYPASINNSVLLSILLFIRHSIVHDYREIVYEANNQNPLIVNKNIPLNNRYGTLRHQYLDHLYKTVLTKKPSCTHIKIPAYNLHDNYLTVDLWLTKKSTVGYDETIISFSADTLGLIHRFTRNEFFVLFRDIFKVLLK